MLNLIYVKKTASGEIRSFPYDLLANELKQHPGGLVGVEFPLGGNPQHYYYQAVGDEVRRYPLRKGDKEGYTCMRGYASLEKNIENERYFGRPNMASSPPVLPTGCLFFTESDRSTIQQMLEKERMSKLEPKETTPFFPDLALTQAQQDYLYKGPVLKGGVVFKEELHKILNHPALSVKDKETILKACISKERIPLSGEPEVLAKTLQNCFLTIGQIARYPADILSSEARTGSKTGLKPSVKAIQLFYVECIQSHLQNRVEKESLNVFPPTAALLRLGDLAVMEEIETYKGLNEQEEICYNALNTLMTLAGTPREITAGFQEIIENDPKFMSVFDALHEIMSDLKDAIANKDQTPSNPKYEMVYRDFFAAHGFSDEDGFSLESFYDSTLFDSAYSALKAINPYMDLVKQLEKMSASPDERPYMKNLVYGMLNTAKGVNNPLMTRQLVELLLKYQLLDQDEINDLFLESVVKGKMGVVDLLLQQDPNLLLHQSDVQDYSGRKWKNITAVQYANWAIDTDTLSVMMKHIPDDAAGERIRAQVKLQIEAVDEAGIEYSLDGQTFKEKQYPYKELTTAYAKFRKDDNETNFLSIVYSQRMVPVYVAHQYCTTAEREFNFRQRVTQLPSKRTFAFYHSQFKLNKQWYPLDETIDNPLYQKFVVVGARVPGTVACSLSFTSSSNIAEKIDPDFLMLSELFKLKTGELASLKAQLLSPRCDNTPAFSVS